MHAAAITMLAMDGPCFVGASSCLSRRTPHLHHAQALHAAHRHSSMTPSSTFINMRCTLRRTLLSVDDIAGNVVVKKDDELCFSVSRSEDLDLSSASVTSGMGISKAR